MGKKSGNGEPKAKRQPPKKPGKPLAERIGQRCDRLMKIAAGLQTISARNGSPEALKRAVAGMVDGIVASTAAFQEALHAGWNPRKVARMVGTVDVGTAVELKLEAKAQFYDYIETPFDLRVQAVTGEGMQKKFLLADKDGRPVGYIPRAHFDVKTGEALA